MSLRSRKSTSASSQCMRSVRSLRGPDVFNGRLATGTAAMRSRPTVAGTTAITPRTRGGPCSPDPSQDRVRRRQMAFVVVRDRDPESQCLRYWPHALSPPGRRRCGVEILRCRARASDCGAEGALCRGPSQHRGARGARRAHYRSRTGSERATHLRDLPLRGARSLVVWLVAAPAACRAENQLPGLRHRQRVACRHLGARRSGQLLARMALASELRAVQLALDRLAEAYPSP